MADFLNLPAEIRQPIYLYCCKEDLINLACCSKEYYESVKHVLWHSVKYPWTALSDTSFRNTNLENLKFTRTLQFSNNGDSISSNTTSLDLEEMDHNYRQILKLCDSSKSMSIKFIDYIVKQGIFLAFTLLGNIRSISIESCKDWTRFDGEPLHNASSLRRIVIVNCDILDGGMEQITANAINLLEFELYLCPNVTFEGLKYLSRLPQLRKLVIQKCPSISANGYTHLGKLLNLAELYLSYTPVDNLAMRSVSQLRYLKKLSVDHCNLGDGWLRCISQLKYLTYLNLNCPSISDSEILNLSNLTSLKELDLSWCKKLSDVGISSVGKLLSLTVLRLAYCYLLTDAGLLNLGSLTLLRELDISYCQEVSDTGLIHIAKLTSLKVLRLCHCNGITNDGLLNLCFLNSLNQLDIRSYELTSIGLSYISKLRSLRILTLDSGSYCR